MSESWDENDTWKNEEEEEEEARPRTTRRRRAPRNEKQSNLYLLTGLVFGMVLGLVYSWLISPVRYTDTEPSSLAASYKDEYRMVIALAYNANHNLGRARERLALLQAGDPVQILAAQAQRMLAANQSPQEARALALLAADLSRNALSGGKAGEETLSPQAIAAAETAQQTPSPTVEAGTATAEAAATAAGATLDVSAAVQTPTVPLPTATPTITLTPIATFTPRPTASPTRALDAPFILKTKKELCGATAQPGLIQVEVTSLDGKPLPGVKIIITWQNGEEQFFTGLAPEIDSGYADFTMAPGVIYTIKVGDASKPVSGLTTPSCGGGWKFVFEEGKQ